MKYRIFMPTEFPSPLMDDWGEDYILDVNRSGRPLTRTQMMERMAEADAMVINLDDVIDREMIKGAPKLKVITLFASCTFNIDVAYATERGIKICVTPGEIFENTADLTFALLTATARRIPQADAYIRKGLYQQWHPALFLGGDIYGKTLGILGLGKIGAAVARRAKGFGMNIIYTALHGPKPELEEEIGCSYVSLEELIEQSDFLSLHCKLTPETEHIIDQHALESMKPTAYLINTGRGKLVNERSLAEALKAGVISGAGLDVFEYEPQIVESLKTLDNIVMTPHLGASSLDNRIRMAEIALRSTIEALT